MTIMIHKMHIILFIIFIIYTPIFCSGNHRKLLHQPFFPSDALPPTAQPPRQQPKYPFSSTSTPFFPLPFSPPPPPPPPPVTAAAVTFPANISSLSFKPPSTKPVSRKLVFLATALSVLAAALVASSAMIIVRFRHKKTPGMKRNENCRLFPPDISSSDKPSPAPTNISGEFLLLGTLRGVQENYNVKNGFFSSSAASSAGEYHRLSSPELRPLPPLPRHQPFSSEFFYHEEEEEQEEVFFSPNLSPSNNNNNNNNIKDSSNNATNNNNPSSPGDIFRNHGSNSINDSSRSSVSSFPVDSVSSNSPFRALNPSLGSLNLDSPDLIENDFRAKPIFRNGCSNETHNPFSEKDHFLGKRENLLIPFPPPLPPPRFWEYFEPGKGRQIAADNMEESSLKPRLKPLHWDKVRASSDRAMVWDQIKSSSFQLNEEMIETLFMVNGSGSSSSENTRRLAQAKSNEQNRVLDPKKSQNIAILLRALNVTVDEVGDALIEGTTDTLGSELLESLLKMAPSEDEERKLKESKDESAAKLGPAEKFLKAVLDIPFAFQRVDALLYIANFDSEVEYLEKSFETLKAACEELKNSRMFRKLLDAVLQTGNRVNLGTDRGDARAFKLDTLLKLVDVKGTDGKTTLLHFVVQEISYAEGSSQGSAHVKSDVESRKLGLLAVSGLSSELDNVKKAADMDSDALGVEVAKLFNGIGKIKDVLKLECGERFSGSMKGFLDRAEGAIVNLRSLESECSGSVKAITEFFHGDSGKEDTRIFTVVRDFVSILDGVCKEVGKVNERNFVRSGLPVSSNIFPVFPATMIGIQT